jgi:hypothetical protein
MTLLLQVLLAVVVVSRPAPVNQLPVLAGKLV